MDDEQKIGVSLRSALQNLVMVTLAWQEWFIGKQFAYPHFSQV